MKSKTVKCGKLNISNNGPFTLIAGPCQLESEKHAMDIATELKIITEKQWRFGHGRLGNGRVTNGRNGKNFI